MIAVPENSVVPTPILVLEGATAEACQNEKEMFTTMRGRVSRLEVVPALSLIHI